MLSIGAIAALVGWLVMLVTRLWKIQNDLLERVRARGRKNGHNEKLARLEAWLPGVDWNAPSNDNDTKAKPKKEPKPDGRRRGNNKNRNEHGRAKYPPELKRVEEKLRVPEQARRCTRCGVEMLLKEWLPREVLEKIPAQFFVRLFLRERLQCPCCQAECAVGETPDTLKDNSSLGVDLVVDALVDHFQDAVPFERMARDAKAQGVPLAANTLARSVYAAVDQLDPITKHIFQRCVGSGVVGADATSMPVLDREVPRGIRRAALWNLLGDGRWSYFGYAATGHGDRLKELLQGCTLDVIQCDGSPALNAVARVARGRAGCHSHARSKLVDAVKLSDERAVEGLHLYAELFAVEAVSKALRESHADRLRRRQIESRPILEKLWRWVDGQSPQVEPRSPFGGALGYLRRQRATLELFLRDGRVALTNNAVERELRTYVLDRKTWLFCGNESNAKRTAAALTVIRTCKLLGVNPRAYLRVTLRKLLGGEKSAASLWPENFHEEQARQKAC